MRVAVHSLVTMVREFPIKLENMQIDAQFENNT